MTARAGRAQAAHALTLLRLFLAPVLVWAILARSAGTAVAVFAAACVSDFADGRVARRLQTAGTIGAWLDPVCDVTFLLAGLIAYVALGHAPWWVPASFAAAFAYYLADSRRRSATPTPLPSRVGHVGGVLNYVVLGVLVIDETAGLGVLSASARLLIFAGVPIYSALSITARVRAAAMIQQ